MDYEDLPFCCRHFVVGHLARDCSRGSHLVSSSTWWKNSLCEHLTARPTIDSASSSNDDSRPGSPFARLNMSVVMDAAPQV